MIKSFKFLTIIFFLICGLYLLIFSRKDQQNNNQSLVYTTEDEIDGAGKSNSKIDLKIPKISEKKSKQMSGTNFKSDVEEFDYEAMYRDAVFMRDPEKAMAKYPELAKGNPQKTKWIYMFQAYVWPKNINEDGELIVPLDYSGSWKGWDKEGELAFTANYKDDLKHGNCITYKNGYKLLEANYENGQKHGVVKMFYENGELSSKINYVNGRIVGLSTHYDEVGRAEKIEHRGFNGQLRIIYSEKDGIDLREKYRHLLKK